jgi:hypothetical protein
VAALATQAADIQEDAVADLRALNPPEEDQALIEEAYDLLDQQVEIGREIAEAAEAGDEARIQQLVAQIEPLDEQANQIARDYGLVECGS